MKKQEKGITLIALIITVIVMLILAAVAINLTIGDNGIFRRSDEGAQIYINAANKEATSLNDVDTEMEKLMNQVNNSEQIKDVIYVQDKLYALTKSGEVKSTSLVKDNIVSKVELGDTVITKSGIKQKGNYSFIDNDGKVYTWGYNESGQLGNGNNENSDKPICISDIEGSALKGKNITNIIDYNINSQTSNDFPMYAIDEDGKVYAWGYNGYGMLGNGTNESSNKPICISDIQTSALYGKKITEITNCNNYFIIAKDQEGNIYTWGHNLGGLGNGTDQDSNVPICVNDVTGSELKRKKSYLYRVSRAF